MCTTTKSTRILKQSLKAKITENSVTNDYDFYTLLAIAISRLGNYITLASKRNSSNVHLIV